MSEKTQTQKAAADGGQVAAVSEAPIEMERRLDAVKIGEWWVVEYEMCHSRRSCRDTKHVVVPKEVLRYPRSRVASIWLKPGQKALILYRQWSNIGNLKWNNLCLYEARDNGMYYICWKYNEWSSISEVVEEVRRAYSMLKDSGLEGWKELFELWWEPFGKRLSISLDDVVMGL